MPCVSTDRAFVGLLIQLHALDAFMDETVRAADARLNGPEAAADGNPCRRLLELYTRLLLARLAEARNDIERTIELLDGAGDVSRSERCRSRTT